MTLTAATTKACSICGIPFHPARSMQVVCGLACAKRVPVKSRKEAAKQRKADIAETRARKEALKTTKDWMRDAQQAFNAYVRFRDVSAGYGCIDCGKPFAEQTFGGSVDAGHYLSRGSAPHLKFDERNVFAQRKNCNRPGGATRADFRAGVIARIGVAALEALEADQSSPRYRAEDLKAIRDTFRAKLKALKANAP